MPDIRVTHLPELTTPTDDDILPIIDSPASGATTKKITKANLVASTVATITAHASRTDNPHTVTKAQVGLGSADNTTDSAKPISTATQTALDAKAALVHAHAQSDVTSLTTSLAGKEPSVTAGTTSQYYRGDKTFQTLDKAAVGLPLVQNIDATARANHTGTQSADSLTDGTSAKVYTATERTKLAGVATGATANDTDANLKNRANHTGTQTAATISDFAESVDDRVDTLLVAGTGLTKTYDDAANTLTLAATGGSTAARYHVTVPFENLAAYQNLTGGSATAVNNSGYIQLQTGGTADSYVILGKNYGGSSMPSTTMQNITGYARLVLNTGNGEINYRFFTDNSNLSVSTAKQVGFRTAGGTLYASSGNGTTEQTTALTLPATNTFTAFSAECVDGVSVKFFMNGVLVATHTTSIPPAASGATNRLCVPGVKMTNYAANNYMAIWIADAGYSYQPY